MVWGKATNEISVCKWQYVAPLVAPSVHHWVPLRELLTTTSHVAPVLLTHVAQWPLQNHYAPLMLLDHYAHYATTTCTTKFVNAYYEAHVCTIHYTYKYPSLHLHATTSGMHHYAPLCASFVNPQSLILRHILRCFTHFSCMKVSELQISIIASPCLPLVAPSNHILSGW